MKFDNVVFLSGHICASLDTVTCIIQRNANQSGKLRKRWRATTSCENLIYSPSPPDDLNGYVCHPDGIIDLP